MDEIEITVQEASRLLDRLVTERKTLERAAGLLKHLASVKQATRESEDQLRSLHTAVNELEKDREALVAQMEASKKEFSETLHLESAKHLEELHTAKQELEAINKQIGEAKAAKLATLEELQLAHESKISTMREEHDELLASIKELRETLASLQQRAAAIAKG